MVACALLLPVWNGEPAELSPNGSETSMVNLQGRLKCLGSDGTLQPPIKCAELTERMVLETDAGDLWRFDPQDPRTGILAEPRLFTERLHVQGRAQDQRVQIVELHIVRSEGHVLPHYRCEVCNITAYAPGPCWCCRQPFEYRERPAADADADAPKGRP